MSPLSVILSQLTSLLYSLQSSSLSSLFWNLPPFLLFLFSLVGYYGTQNQGCNVLASSIVLFCSSYQLEKLNEKNLLLQIQNNSEIKLISFTLSSHFDNVLTSEKGSYRMLGVGKEIASSRRRHTRTTLFNDVVSRSIQRRSDVVLG